MKFGRKRSHSRVNFKLLVQKSIPSRESIQGIADPQLLGTKNLIAELCAQGVHDGIILALGCAGVPEYVDLEAFLTTADNIDWQVQPQEDFALITGFPWVVQSDVRCAGIAEAEQGAGRGESDFVYVTVSSGISHTHFLEGRAVTGSQGEAIGFGLTEVEISGQSHALEKSCHVLNVSPTIRNAGVEHSGLIGAAIYALRN